MTASAFTLLGRPFAAYRNRASIGFPNEALSELHVLWPWVQSVLFAAIQKPVGSGRRVRGATARSVDAVFRSRGEDWMINFNRWLHTNWVTARKVQKPQALTPRKPYRLRNGEMCSKEAQRSVGPPETTPDTTLQRP